MNIKINFYLITGDGGEYPLNYISKFEIIKSIDSPTISLMLEGYPENPPINAVGVLMVSSEEKISFLIDEEKIEINNGTISYQIEARDAGAAMLDNEAMPAKFANISFYDIYLTYIKKVCEFKNEIFKPGFIGEFSVGKSSNIWQVANRFCTQVYKRSPYVCDGKILLFERRQAQKIDSEIISFSLKRKPCKIISTVWLQNANGEYEAKEENKNSISTRERYLSFAEEWQGSEKSAQKIIRDSLADSIEYKIVIFGKQNIKIGQTIEFEILNEKYQNLAVSKIVVSGKENLIYTTITATDADYL